MHRAEGSLPVVVSHSSGRLGLPLRSYAVVKPTVRPVTAAGVIQAGGMRERGRLVGIGVMIRLLLLFLLLILFVLLVLFFFRGKERPHHRIFLLLFLMNKFLFL